MSKAIKNDLNCIKTDLLPMERTDMVVMPHEHNKFGEICVTASKLELFTPPSVNGREVQLLFINQLVPDNAKMLNGTIQEYLLKNPEIIPEAWKFDSEGNPQFIYFFGTQYRAKDNYNDIYYSYIFWAFGWNREFVPANRAFPKKGIVAMMRSN